MQGILDGVFQYWQACKARGSCHRRHWEFSSRGPERKLEPPSAKRTALQSIAWRYRQDIHQHSPASHVERLTRTTESRTSPNFVRLQAATQSPSGEDPPTNKVESLKGSIKRFIIMGIHSARGGMGRLRYLVIPTLSVLAISAHAQTFTTLRVAPFTCFNQISFYCLDATVAARMNEQMPAGTMALDWTCSK
jgi:hypothetical protein